MSRTAPTVTEALSNDTGSSSSDKITNLAILSGNGDANATVTLKEGSNTLGTATANGSGVSSFTPTVADGVHTIVASETDAAGNTGTNSVTSTLTAGSTTATFNALVYTDSNGNSTQDGGDTNLPGVTVNLLDGSGSSTGKSTTTNASGNASFTGLTPGVYQMQAITPAGIGGWLKVTLARSSSRGRDRRMLLGCA